MHTVTIIHPRFNASTKRWAGYLKRRWQSTTAGTEKVNGIPAHEKVIERKQLDVLTRCNQVETGVCGGHSAAGRTHAAQRYILLSRSRCRHPCPRYLVHGLLASSTLRRRCRKAAPDGT